MAKTTDIKNETTTAKEIKPQSDWSKLYEYVHDKIMGYDETMKLSKYMILRLQGLKKGQFIGNNKIKKHADYDYNTILLTFKLCSPQIHQGFEANKSSFKDESHRFNYALTFVDREINNVVVRLEKAKKAEEKTRNLELSNQAHEGAEYKSTNKDNKQTLNETLRRLW